MYRCWCTVNENLINVHWKMPAKSLLLGICVFLKFDMSAVLLFTFSIFCFAVAHRRWGVMDWCIAIPQFLIMNYCTANFKVRMNSPLTCFWWDKAGFRERYNRTKWKTVNACKWMDNGSMNCSMNGWTSKYCLFTISINRTGFLFYSNQYLCIPIIFLIYKSYHKFVIKCLLKRLISLICSLENLHTKLAQCFNNTIIVTLILKILTDCLWTSYSLSINNSINFNWIWQVLSYKLMTVTENEWLLV